MQWWCTYKGSNEQGASAVMGDQRSLDRPHPKAIRSMLLSAAVRVHLHTVVVDGNHMSEETEAMHKLNWPNVGRSKKA